MAYPEVKTASHPKSKIAKKFFFIIYGFFDLFIIADHVRRWLPNLSTSQPQAGHVQPPHSLCSRVGLMIFCLSKPWPHRGQGCALTMALRPVTFRYAAIPPAIPETIIIRGRLIMKPPIATR